jgi:plasmid stabilization system protein ParE
MNFTLSITQQAKQDAQVIYDWIVERAPGGAERWYEAFQSALDRLETDAHRNALAPESAFFSNEIRQLLFKTRKGLPYRILYCIADQTVVVLNVRGPGQQFVQP